MNDRIEGVIDLLKDLEKEEGVPKNVRSEIESIIRMLKDDSDQPITINKCLDMLDKISEETSLQAFIRPQIWNIASVLEKIIS